MALISITRLRIRAWRFLPAFLWLSIRSARQAERAPGFLGGRLGAELGDRTFWTLTMWTDAAAMRAYRGGGAHKAAMPRLAHWCDEAAVAHWSVDVDARLPDWAAAHERMVADCRRSPVQFPTLRQQAGEIPAPTIPGDRGQRMRPRASTRY